MKRIIHICLSASLLATVLLFGSASFADARPEFYLGVSQVYNSINTDARNVPSYDEEETLYFPALDSDYGASLTWGMEFRRFALEFGLTASHHEGNNAAGLPIDADYGIFDVNFKKFIGSSPYIKPYLLVGFCVTVLEVENGAYYDGYYPEWGDADFTGIGLNLGYGLTLKLGDSIGLKGEVIYRSVAFTHASGVYEDGELSDTLDGSGLCFNAGINLYF